MFVPAGGLKALPAAFPGPRLAASLTSLALSDCYGIKVGTRLATYLAPGYCTEG
jgi:hypothetical protein